MFYSNAWKHLTARKQMRSSNSLDIKLTTDNSYTCHICTYKKYLALDYLKGFICHRAPTNNISYNAVVAVNNAVIFTH